MDGEGLPVRQLLHLPAQSSRCPDWLPAEGTYIAGKPCKAWKAGRAVAGKALGDPVIATHGALQRFKSLWLSTWPLWALLVFAVLAVVRLLPGGYGRTAASAPILLMVPGSLTLGAIFG